MGSVPDKTGWYYCGFKIGAIIRYFDKISIMRPSTNKILGTQRREVVKGGAMMKPPPYCCNNEAEIGPDYCPVLYELNRCQDLKWMTQFKGGFWIKRCSEVQYWFGEYTHWTKNLVPTIVNCPLVYWHFPPTIRYSVNQSTTKVPIYLENRN